MKKLDNNKPWVQGARESVHEISQNAPFAKVGDWNVRVNLDEISTNDILDTLGFLAQLERDINAAMVDAHDEYHMLASIEELLTVKDLQMRSDMMSRVQGVAFGLTIALGIVREIGKHIRGTLTDEAVF